MISTKAQEILNRVRTHFKKRKPQVSSETVMASSKDERVPVNQDKTDPLFPNGADSGPEPRLPITGPDQGMIPTRLR
jgi:hypothetical protein